MWVVAREVQDVGTAGTAATAEHMDRRDTAKVVRLHLVVLVLVLVLSCLFPWAISVFGAATVFAAWGIARLVVDAAADVGAHTDRTGTGPNSACRLPAVPVESAELVDCLVSPRARRSCP